jgi:alkylation response protein AidB-like acyl-CoA dehydrogenase
MNYRYIVMCKTAENEVSAIVVEKGTKGITIYIYIYPHKGLSFGKLEEKMGWRSSPTAMVMFEDCRVPRTNLIGRQGDGFKFAMKALDGGRINIASTSLGGAALAFDTAHEYMGVRK